MIISEKAKVKSSKYYEKLGYDITQKYIFVDLEHVPKGSRTIILAKCDFCENKRQVIYRDYNDNVSRGGKFSCSQKCGILKSKENCFKIWGVDSKNKLQTTKDKVKETIKRKWGVSHISKVEEISKLKSEKMKSKSLDTSKRVSNYRSNLTQQEIDSINEKRKFTNLEKWGVENVSKSEQIKDKVRNTFYEKWNGYTFQSQTLNEKVKKTNIERWGFEYPSKSQDIKNKTLATNLEKWGFKTPSMNDFVKNKIKNTLLEKYNVTNIMFSEEFRNKFNITNESNYVKYIGNRNYEFNCDKCNSIYIIDYDNYYKRKFRNVETCTICFPILENSSIKESELRNFIFEIYNDEIIDHYRDGLEIDIYLPKLKLGIEFNGIFWHCDERLPKDYHLNKTNYFKDKGIKIIHVWEDDWDFKRDIVKSQIANLIGNNKNKISARKCEVREIEDSKLVKSFLEKNHIQGFIRSKVKIGLFYQNELISIMCFDTLEGRKKMPDYNWNLSRFCSKLETNVVGGASKLLKYFILKYEPIRIISFADKDWSEGKLYYKLQFQLVKDLLPDYKFIIDKRRVNKQRLTKKKLIKLGHDENMTGDEIVEKLGISKIWGVGQLKFEMKL